jgi:hypothetical protein
MSSRTGRGEGGTPRDMYTAGSRHRAPDRRRTLIVSISILGLSTVLAAALVSSRRTGLPVSFQSPEGWSESRRGKDYVEFRDLRYPHNPKQLIIHLLDRPPSMTAADLAVRVMGVHLSQFLEISSLTLPEDFPLGSLPGARMNMPQTGDYVHVGLLPPDETRAVILRYHTTAAFTERDIQVCQRVVESVEVAVTP